MKKGDEEGKPKSITRRFVKGQLKSGKGSVPQFRTKQQSERPSKKRKLQDDEEKGEQRDF